MHKSKFFRRFVPMLLVVAVGVLLSGCTSPLSMLTGASSSSGTSTSDGGEDGRIGSTLHNVFFDFTVDSVDYVDQYGSYKPADGMQLIDAVITVTNNSGEEQPMYRDDFQLQWHDLGDGDEDFTYSISMPDDSTVLPDEYTLKKGDTTTYHAIYEAPAEAADFSISYQEYFTDDTEGDVFFVYFDKGDSAPKEGSVTTAA